MISSRDEILRRVRVALADQTRPPPIPRRYRRADAMEPDVELFVHRVEDYRAHVHRNAGVDAVLATRGVRRIVVPAGFPAAWRPRIQTVDEPADAQIDLATVDEVSAVITTCRLAIAETGTIVLDHGPGMGARALTLVPDYHLVVVRTDQIVASVPDAVAALDPTRPLTWISGPSATSDIELNRVEGVHGPRTLDVLITAPTGSA